MKPSDLILRCYAEKEKEGTWFAMCIDLNLYARGDSDHEAKHKLHLYIKEYIGEALTKDVEYFDSLIPRRAPLSFRFKYHLISMKCTFRNAKKNCTHRKFNEHLPLVPA